MLAFENSFKNAIYKMMEIISEQIPNNVAYPIKAYITGGCAVHFYTNNRVSDDVDLILSHRVNIPSDLSVVWLDENENINQVSYDYTYNPTFGLLHEDFEDRAELIKTIEAIVTFCASDNSDFLNSLSTSISQLTYTLGSNSPE